MKISTHTSRVGCDGKVLCGGLWKGELREWV